MDLLSLETLTRGKLEVVSQAYVRKRTIYVTFNYNDKITSLNVQQVLQPIFDRVEYLYKHPEEQGITHEKRTLTEKRIENKHKTKEEIDFEKRDPKNLIFIPFKINISNALINVEILKSLSHVITLCNDTLKGLDLTLEYKQNEGSLDPFLFPFCESAKTTGRFCTPYRTRATQLLLCPLALLPSKGLMPLICVVSTFVYGPRHCF